VGEQAPAPPGLLVQALAAAEGSLTEALATVQQSSERGRPLPPWEVAEVVASCASRSAAMARTPSEQIVGPYLQVEP